MKNPHKMLFIGNCRAKVTVQRGVETQSEREGYYMNEQCGEGGRNFALSAYGTICRRDEVKQMSREIAKGL